MLADVETNEALPADEMHLCPHEDGPVAIFPMSSRRRRIVATFAGAPEGVPTLDIVRSTLQERAVTAHRASPLAPAPLTV